MWSNAIPRAWYNAIMKCRGVIQSLFPKTPWHVRLFQHCTNLIHRYAIHSLCQIIKLWAVRGWGWLRYSFSFSSLDSRHISLALSLWTFLEWRHCFDQSNLDISRRGLVSCHVRSYVQHGQIGGWNSESYKQMFTSNCWFFDQPTYIRAYCQAGRMLHQFSGGWELRGIIQQAGTAVWWLSFNSRLYFVRLRGSHAPYYRVTTMSRSLVP